MREVPKKALPSERFGCFGAKMSDQRQAVDGSVLGELSSGSLKNAGEQIDRGDRFVRHNSRWNGGWPACQKGHPDATFVAVSFSASQRSVFGRISLSVQPPLSLVKMIMVFSSIPCFFNSASISLMQSSMDSTMAAYLRFVSDIPSLNLY